MTRPIDSTIRKSNDIILSACDVYVEVPTKVGDRWINLGYTEGGVVFRYSYELYPVTIAKYGNRVIGHILVGESCSIKTNIISIKPVIENKPQEQKGWWWWKDKSDPESTRFKTLELLYPTLSHNDDVNSTTNIVKDGYIITTYRVKLKPLSAKIEPYFTITLLKATNIASLNISFQHNKPIRLPVEFIALHEEEAPLFIIGE